MSDQPIVRHLPRDTGKSLTLKLQSTHALTADQIKRVACNLPRDADPLREMAPGLEDSDLDKILKITRAHERDQERFQECVSVLRAYAQGGNYGMHLLNKLHDVIIMHYEMQDEKWEVLTAAGTTLNFETGELY